MDEKRRRLDSPRTLLHEQTLTPSHAERPRKETTETAAQSTALRTRCSTQLSAASAAITRLHRAPHARKAQAICNDAAQRAFGGVIESHSERGVRAAPASPASTPKAQVLASQRRSLAKDSSCE